MRAHIPYPVGNQFGMLTVLEYLGRVGRYASYRFACACGAEKVASIYKVKSGKVRSCGCAAKSAIVSTLNGEGMTYHPLYHMWFSMMNRCYDPKNKLFHRYGGRGIKVYEPWHCAKTFVDEVGPRPGKGLHLDRIDNDGNYEPGNVRWLTSKANNRAKPYLQRIEFKGRMMLVTEISEELGIYVDTLRLRLRKGDPDPFRPVTRPCLKKGEKHHG